MKTDCSTPHGGFVQIFNPRKLAQMLYEAPEKAGLTIKQAADRMGGIDPKYLSRQLNPDDPGAKLGVEDFVYLLAVCGLDALKYILSVFGYVCFKVPQVGGHMATSMLRIMGNFSKEFSETIREMARSIEDGRIDQKEIARCRKEIHELIEQAAMADAYLASLENGQRKDSQ